MSATQVAPSARVPVTWLAAGAGVAAEAAAGGAAGTASAAATASRLVLTVTVSAVGGLIQASLCPCAVRRARRRRPRRLLSFPRQRARVRQRLPRPAAHGGQGEQGEQGG